MNLIVAQRPLGQPHRLLGHLHVLLEEDLVPVEIENPRDRDHDLLAELLICQTKVVLRYPYERGVGAVAEPFEERLVDADEE